jgi:glutathione S-transferase
MRARLAIFKSGIEVELREITLKNKPPEMLELSAKGTVPVLQLTDGKVIDESLMIMEWTAEQRPDCDELKNASNCEVRALIKINDFEFKKNLDNYKYSVRFPEKSMQEYRQDGEIFLQRLEDKLVNDYLFGETMSFADLAIFPFVRQFAFVDKAWFDSAPYSRLKAWLARCLASQEFQSIMEKYPEWVVDRNQRITFGGDFK